MSDLLQAIRDRRERAGIVRAEYALDYIGLQAWVVRHPEDGDRCYLVDMINRSCSCPDSRCFRIDGEQIDCKHILGLQPEWERLTGIRLPFIYRGRAVADPGFVAIKDADADGEDPFTPL
jgi:hypothetical protein